MKTLLISIALGALVVPAAASAQAAQATPPAPAQDQNTAPRFGRMQADMTRQQAQQKADGLFQRLDLNHDGTLTREEVEQARAQMAGGAAQNGGGDRVERMIGRMFGDAQSVTQVQFEAQALTRFDRQDLNRDGTVTSAERQQARANRTQAN